VEAEAPQEGQEVRLRIGEEEDSGDSENGPAVAEESARSRTVNPRLPEAVVPEASRRSR